ncbi:hypothetical protein KJZ63_00870 [Patescibacteria group bacterium]|nr:hypothetical protein [Patescibacteria group bacterium]
MALLNFQSGDKKSKKLFLGILLTEQSVQAVLWSIDNGQIKVEKKSEIYQITNEEETLKQTDKSLQDLGEESEGLEEVVFGLEPSWSNKSGVLDIKKPILKKLTEDLSLKAIGFIVLTEAVVKHLQKNDTNFNSVLVFYSATQIDVVIVENGQIQKTESVGRSEDTVSDLVEGLARAKATHAREFPPQIQLVSVNLDKEELYEQQQSLIDHDWVGEGHFINIPTITMVDVDIAIESLVNQGGRAVAQVEEIEVKEPLPPATNDKHHQEIPMSPAEFAFKEVNVTPEKPETEMPDDNLAVVPTSFGIPISTKSLPELNQNSPVSIVKHDDDEPAATPKKHSPKPGKFRKWLWEHKLFVGAGFGAGILALLLISIVFMTVAGKAEVTLMLNQRPLSKDLNITLDPTLTESDFANLTLKSQIVSSDFNFNQTNETTGTTLVGEKAKGKIQIANKSDGVKTFTAGTNLTAGNLRFTLDDDVTIASASVEVKRGEEVKTYGTSEANITAVKIGAEGNLPAETKFKVGDFSDSTYEAYSVGALSGGSSRELRVVSENDQAQLLAEVKKKILENAAQKFKDESAADGQKTFVSTGNLSVLEAKYSAKVGDEAKTLTLDLSAQVQAIAYQNEDLRPLADYVLNDLVPEGFVMINKDPEILSAVDTTASGSSVVIAANISSKAVPKIDLEALKKEIMGQSLSSAQAILNGKGEIKSHTIRLIPSIMNSLWKKIPGKATNITITAE